VNVINSGGQVAHSVTGVDQRVHATVEEAAAKAVRPLKGEKGFKKIKDANRKMIGIHLMRVFFLEKVETFSLIEHEWQRFGDFFVFRRKK